MALGNEHSRSEFLQALLNQKKEVTANGGNLVNPAVSPDPLEDNNSRVVDTSYSDPLAPRTVTDAEKYKNSRNGWQRFWDTVGNFVSNINEGIAKYILDPIGDAFIYVGGAISGDHEGAKRAMNYDWTAQYMNVINQLDISHNLMTGDMFTQDYYSRWADTGSAEASRQNINNLHAASFSSDWGNAQGTLETIEQIGGAMLPSIILGIVTGGASAGVQAGVLAGEIAAGTLAGFGQGVNTALNEGAEYGKAAIYGGIQGVAQGSVTAVMHVGFKGGGLGGKVGNMVFGKTGSIAMSNVTKIATNAGVTGAVAAARRALDPVAKQISYDDEAIYKAYGTEEGLVNTLNSCAQAFMTSAALSAASQTLIEGGKYLIKGKEAYVRDFVNQYTASTKEGKAYQKMLKQTKEADSIKEEINNLKIDFAQGKTNMTVEEFTQKINELTGRLETINTDISKAIEKLNIGEEIGTKTVTYTDPETGEEMSVTANVLPTDKYVKGKYADVMNQARSDLLQNINAVQGHANYVAETEKFLTNFINEGLKNGNDIKTTLNAQEIYRIGLEQGYTPEEVETIMDKVIRPAWEAYKANQANKQWQETMASAMKEGVFNVNVENNRITMRSEDGKLLLTPLSGDAGGVRFTYTDGDTRATIVARDNYLLPHNANQFDNAIKLLGMENYSSAVPDSIAIEKAALVTSEATAPTSNETLVISKQTAQEISKSYNAEKVKEYFELMNEHKGSQIIEDGDRYIIISKPVKGDDGQWHSAITYIDSKFKNIQNIEVLPVNSVEPSRIAKTSIAMAAVNDEIVMALPRDNQPKYVKAYGELNHERVLSMNKAEDIVDIVKKQIFDKIAPKKDGYEYTIKLLKGETAKRLFESYNTMKPEELDAAIDELADDIANTKIVSLDPTGEIRTEFLAGHKEDFIKCIKGLLQAKSELSKIAKLEKRFDLTIEKKNEMIAKIRENANARLQKAYEVFKAINKDLKGQIKELKGKKNSSNYLSRNRERVKDMAHGDYTYDKLEDRDVHTINMLAKPMASLERHKGVYKVVDKSVEAISTANRIYTEENYEHSQMDFNPVIKSDLENLERLFRADLGKSELSLETYEALEKYNKDLLAYERQMVQKVIPARKANAIATTNELASYDMSPMQKLLNPIIDQVGGKGGEIFVRYGFGQITKSQLRILQANGNNTKWTVESHDFVNNFVPKGWHSDANAGKLNGVKITKGQLIKTYINVYLAPVNADNINAGGYFVEDSKGKIEWIYKGEGHLDELRAEVDKLMTPETIEFAKNLHEKVINDYLQKAYVQWQRDNGMVDIDLVKDYSHLHKMNFFQTSIDKRVIGDPSFNYGIQRTEDLSALGAVDIMDEINDYIKRLGLQMYMKPAVHEFYALLNSRDAEGISVSQHIAEKYGTNALRDLTNMTDQWLVKNIETQNALTKAMNFLMSGYATAKISDPIRSVKNYLSHTTSNIDLAKMVGGRASRLSKEVKDDVLYLIDNVIPELKYRKVSSELLRGNAPTVFSGVKGKVQSATMFFVKNWDMEAMKQGLFDIVNDLRKNGVDIRSPEGSQMARDMYSLYNMLNVGSTPLHQNKLNDNPITRITFNVLAGAMRANVASYAVQGALYHQYHGVNKAQLEADLQKALELQAQAHKNTEAAEKAYEDGLKTLNKLRDERDELIDNKASKEEIDEARAKVNEQRETNKGLKDDLNNAREEEAKADGEAKTQQNKSDGYREYEFSGGKRIPINIITKMLLQGLGVTAVSILTNYLYGKKKPNEYTVEELVTTVATNSFINWIPVANTLTGAILHGYEIDAPSISVLNNAISVFNDIYKSIQQGKMSSGILTALIGALEGITGLPLDTIKKYIYGITKIFDPEAAMKFNNIFYPATVNGLTKSYNAYIESGDTKSATAHLNYMVSEFKGGVTNDQINAELVSLSSQGYNAIPKNIPQTYIDDKGNEVQLTAEQITQFTKLYQRSEIEVVKVINSPEYRTATSEERAKLISAVYNHYYNYAKAKVTGLAGSSKIENLLLYTNGNVDLAKYIAYLQKVGSITETKKKTRKELVIEYINRLPMSKQEKILLMYLAGYSVSGNSQKALIGFLQSQGASRTSAVAFVGA